MGIVQHTMIARLSGGWIGMAASERGICRIVLPKRTRKQVEQELRSDCTDDCKTEKNRSRSAPVLAALVAQLRRYFSGNSVPFDLSVDLRCYTNFQRAVWKAAKAIPYGETRSYAWIAQRIGNPRAVRAVGEALGANPVPLIIP